MFKKICKSIVTFMPAIFLFLAATLYLFVQYWNLKKELLED